MSNPQPQGPSSMAELINLARSVTPAQAKQMVMNMVDTGKITREQLAEYEHRARKELGL